MSSEPESAVARVVLCAGVFVDSETRTVHALGRMLPVTCVSYSPGSEERPGTDRMATPSARLATEMVYKTPDEIAAAIARPIPATAESCHFNIVCENGWWVEVALWPQDGLLSFADPRRCWGEIDEFADASEMLRFLDEVAARPQFVPTVGETAGYCADPWGGLAPGEWDHSMVKEGR